MRPELMNALVLAYLGDAVFEVYIREYLIVDKKIAKPHDLQMASVRYVCAEAQAAFIKKAVEEQFLTDEEIGIYKRGRNTHGHGRSNGRTKVHNQSSGFEAIIGTLYLRHDIKRIEEIVEFYKKTVESANDEKNEE